MASRTAPGEAVEVGAGLPPEQGRSQGCGAPLEVSLSIGPLEPREVTSALHAMERLTQGASWRQIQGELLDSQTTTRAHLIAHRLAAAVADETSCTARANQAGGLEVRFLATGIPAIRELEQTLRMLRTPFAMTVESTEPDSGRLSASWDLGWDEPTVLVLGRPPHDRHARSELWECMEQLVGG